MMDIAYLLRGVAIGFSVAAPVGPIAVLCIRRSLTEGQRVGFVSGLGATTADTFYGLLASFGVEFLTNRLVGAQPWLRLAGGVFLIYLGLQTLATRSIARPAAGNYRKLGLGGAYLSTLVLTLTNPATILSFAAIFAGLGALEFAQDQSSIFFLVTGVSIGSALWWLALSSFAASWQTMLSPQHLQWINRLSGTTLLAFGAVALVRLLG